MPQPVVHFEIIGNDPENLRDYYSGLFGWEFETPSRPDRQRSMAKGRDQGVTS
jgi:predicted enzyme related to lactoylglutathione lyase